MIKKDHAAVHFLVCDVCVFPARRSGELKTAAAWTRDFVASHPAYARDSVVPPETAYDLLQRCHDVGVGAAHEPSLLGPEPKVAPVRKENAYNVPLARVHFQTSDSLRTLLDQSLSAERKSSPRTYPRPRRRDPSRFGYPRQ